MPLAALASPGPTPTTAAPGRPVISPVAAAISTAAVSVRARTNGTPSRAAASIRRSEPPPGTPNSLSTPQAASRAASASAIVRSVSMPVVSPAPAAVASRAHRRSGIRRSAIGAQKIRNRIRTRWWPATKTTSRPSASATTDISVMPAGA